MKVGGFVYNSTCVAWMGSLESLIPGEGYMLYRQAKDDVTVHFYPSVPASAPRKKVESESELESFKV